MNTRCPAGAVLLIAVLTPFPLAADSIDIGDVKAFVSVHLQTNGSPEISTTQTQIGPPGSSIRAELLFGDPATPFPNRAGGPFASAVATTSGFFAGGVNGFFSRDANPANELVAQGGIIQQITNTTSSPVSVTFDLDIPGPTVRFVGITEGQQRDFDFPLRLGEAQARVILTTELTHPDGSKDLAAPLVYGLSSSRTSSTGVFVAGADDPGDVVTRFDESPGSFGFRLPDRVETDFHVADIGPGDVLLYQYIFATFAGTGSEQVGVFAAVGDPFDLNLTGAHFDLHISGVTGPIAPTSPIPEPGTLAMLGVGLLLLGRRCRRPTAQ